ncbi:type II toxin-antitoxin system HicB family antitoxin [Xylophilus rhododendri]|uniref:Type II toxin-antitoxin system HicB family antitoxin n=1 Tax=Xylophilus rhododendri TaxID=2697032 RepID=A0A857J5K6_9BURK|nr:type II toxin-antitoxin system HicB family antitoxin [Xylophilus rhododendri]QHI99260.1 type II toxin-antitoxin system HicB family antitoxin [Xylophilus rhododendri]
MTHRNYPASFEPDPDGGFVVTFRDIPEAITQGDTREEAESMAGDALITAMDFYFEEGRLVPPPTKARRREVLVALPLSVAAKVELLNLVVQRKERPADLARAMGVKPQEVTRLLNLHHATKIDTLAAAFRALGGELELNIRFA